MGSVPPVFTRRAICRVSALCFLAACTQAPDFAPTSLPFFGTGYRYEGDTCRRLGEDSFTNQYLDDAADLVACIADADDPGTFQTQTGAREVARREGYILYSVPIR